MVYPASEQPYIDGESRPPLTWADARQRLAASITFWLATVRPDGRPHVAPLLAVWRDDTLYFAANGATRKARNLARNDACVLTTAGDRVDLVVEGSASIVRDDATLKRVADLYEAKYGWVVTVRDGALHGEGAPTAGPSPYDLYRVSLEAVFAFGTTESFGAMRWRFQEV